MASIYKHRHLNYNKPVKVYRNLVKNCFSICQNGLVVAHSEKVSLSNCRFIVSEPSRQRAIRKKQRNVHAYIEGFLKKRNYKNKGRKFSYNPFKFPTFYLTSNNKPLLHCKKVLLTLGGNYIIE